ncbi:MAG: hypothetical protein A2V93_00390 [Ignavibacteria bacterium RBG_16_34_14]|nr:MAG: hypothetical protein A2V93_00390 [Ignavibacteria bacterium RBG_16_34_14]
MKKLFFIVLCFAINSFSQDSKNLLELKEEIKSVQQNPSLEINKVIQEKPEKKKPILGILYSLLLPGMGELYADSYSSGKYFTVAEGALWGIFTGMNIYGNWQKDKYKSFAISKAGITTEDKDEEYYSIISQYLDIEEYNDEKALEREFDKMYPERFFWKWNTQQERKEYRSLWLSSEQTFNDVRFVVGAMILNRIASAINAVRLVSAYNKRITEEVSWNFSVGISKPVNLPHSITFNFQKSF